MRRSKSIPIRSSIQPLDPYVSPASLPEEANQGDGSKRCGQQIGSGGDTDVEIVTDTFDGRNKNRHRLGTSEIDRGGGSQPLNLLEACIVCEITDDLVSKCCGTDCLLWFHEECLDAEFGSVGEEEPESSYYCPYCWFRILAVKSMRLEEKAVGAEMAVFKYLDEEMGNRGGEVNESVPKGQEESVETTDIVSDQEVEGEKGAYSSKVKQQVQVDEEDSDEESRGEDMELIKENDQPEADKENFEVPADKSEDMNVDKVIDDEQKEATENFQDAEDEGTAGDQTKANAVAGKERDFSPFWSMQESFSGKENDQVQQNEQRRRKRRLILNAFDSDVSSNGSTNEPNGEDAAEQMTSLALVVTSPSGMIKNQQREHSRTTNVDNLKTTRDIPDFKKDHKRRMLWTSEEEYMLKVGVDKFSAEAKKNMPWRKILEWGRKVFHETRTPADLKDKWRNMNGARLKNKQDSTTVSGM